MHVIPYYLITENMNRIFLLILLLFSINTVAQEYVFLNDHCIVNKNVVAINFFHITSKVTKEDIKEGEKIGSIQKLPEFYSKVYHNQILESQALYEQGEFEKAANKLKVAYKYEPSNFFIAENYARALYKVDGKRSKSFEVYKKLVNQLDLQHNEQSNELTIDMWHREVYWKLATLYLDIQDYESAIKLLIKFQLSITSFIGKPIYTQVLEYMTECTFYLNEFEISKKYAQNTLKYDSENSYIKELLKKMK